MANPHPPNSFPTNTQNQFPPGYAPPGLNHSGHPPSGIQSSQTFGIKMGSQPYNNVSEQTITAAYINNLGQQSSNSSPAFNKPVMTNMQAMNSQGSPQRPMQYQHNLTSNVAPQTQVTTSSPSIRPAISNPGPIPTTASTFNQYPPSSGAPSLGIRPHNQMQLPIRPQQSQWGPRPAINQNAPPLMPSSQPLSSLPQPMINGPTVPVNTSALAPQSGPTGVRPSMPPSSHYVPPFSSASGIRPSMNPHINGAPISRPPGPTFSGPPTSRPLMPPTTAGLSSAPSSNSSLGISSGLPSSSPSGFQSGTSVARPSGLQSGPPGLQSMPPGLPSGPPGLQSGPPGLQSVPPGLQSGPPLVPQNGPPLGPPSGPTGFSSGPSSLPSGPPLGPPSGPANIYPQSSQSSMNSRYPQNVPPQPNYNHQGQPSQPNYNHQGQPSHQNQTYNQYNGPQSLNNQMGQMSITQSGFNQMWGQQMFDLLQQRHILPEYPDDPPEIRLGNQFSEAVNCSPEIFRCTINRIPDTNSLLQKSRLPLGILIHPFKDLNHLPVIQCTSIVRCRACRTYINPFVYFVDSKRWKCNLCYRVNDLPEEFQYDPVSKSYGDPTRRPEIKSATIEFIAPGEYMLRPPQPAVYLFLLDVSQIGRESEYLQVFCETLKSQLDQLPGDARTQVGFICYDTNVHFYLLGEGLTRPREMTVIDIDDVFLPSPESLLVNLGERREMIQDLLDVLPKRHTAPGVPASALGAALQAAYKLMAPTGGRITVIQTCLPNVGPGALTSREDPNARSSKEVAHLNPATDFYKRLALECSGAQIAVDVFLINSQYSDLATLSGISKFSGGTVYHIPLFKASRAWQADQFRRMLTRYLTRKIGFEAVMRIRCTRGIAIHTFHGNFFVRSTDLLSLPNVSPDAGFGMQLTIEESLSDLQQVCFQAALLYTSSKGERRIRVHTMCLPVANNLTDVLHSADQQCIIGLLTKMAVDRCQQSSLSDAREALSNVAVDTLAAHRLAQNLPGGAASASLHAPACLRLLPLYLSALLKHPAFRIGTSTRLDDRVAAMCDMKTLPLPQLLRSVYPDLYALHELHRYLPAPAPTDTAPDDPAPAEHDDDDAYPDPPRLHLTAERINSNGVYLLDDGETMTVYVGHAASAQYLAEAWGVAGYHEVADEARELPRTDHPANVLLHAFVEKLNEDRPYASNILVLRDNSPSRRLFTDRLVDDRMESAFSYYEFLQHVKSLMK